MDHEFTGCRSRFACKVKNSKTNGFCAVRDSTRLILEKAKDADVIVFGSPVYDVRGGGTWCSQRLAPWL